ncbi:uncharacterized protein LOC135812166 [Sycon ciliatum]|uniref:uncharacterized protein LOC135812166 n=1 Tax=Sycon ciliatum TaxID=27933 RepID=UPI0031F641C9
MGSRLSLIQANRRDRILKDATRKEDNRNPAPMERLLSIQMESLGLIELEEIRRAMKGWQSETTILAVISFREDGWVEEGFEINHTILDYVTLKNRVHRLKSLVAGGQAAMYVFRQPGDHSDASHATIASTASSDVDLVADYPRPGPNGESTMDEIHQRGLYAIFYYPGHEPLAEGSGSDQTLPTEPLTRVVIQQVSFDGRQFELENRFLGLRSVEGSHETASGVQNGVMWEPAMITVPVAYNQVACKVALDDPTLYWNTQAGQLDGSWFKLRTALDAHIMLCRPNQPQSLLTLCMEKDADKYSTDLQLYQEFPAENHT